MDAMFPKTSYIDVDVHIFRFVKIKHWVIIQKIIQP